MRSSSDEDNSEDDEEKIQNVRSLLIKSSGTKQEAIGDYVFKRKLGDLIFDANFESGNLGSVEQIDRFTYDLMVRPDVANPQFRLWFNFCVSNQRPGQCVIFSFVNLSEVLNLFNDGLTPVVRCRMYPNWTRLRQNQVFYYRSPEHSNRRILAIAFKFGTAPTRNNQHQFALFYPYTTTDLIQFVNRWTVELKRNWKELSKREVSARNDGLKRSVTYLHKSYHQYNNLRRPISSLSLHRIPPAKVAPRSKSSLGIASNALSTSIGTSINNSYRDLWKENQRKFKVRVLTETVLSKPVYRIDIGQTSTNFQNLSKLKVVVIGGWSGNFMSVTNYICQGLIDFTLSDHTIAKALARYIELTVFPMPDPDSIWVGNSRSDIFGQKHIDRNLIEANPRLYENINSIVESIDEICDSSSAVIILSLKVNSSLLGSKVIGSQYENTYRMERHLLLPRLFSRFIDGFYLEKSIFVNKAKRTKLEHLFDSHSDRDNVDIYRFEISPFAFHKRSLQADDFVVYDKEKYLLIGKSISYSLLEFIRRTVSCVLTHEVVEILNSYQPISEDIDDLLLQE